MTLMLKLSVSRAVGVSLSACTDLANAHWHILEMAMDRGLREMQRKRAVTKSLAFIVLSVTLCACAALGLNDTRGSTPSKVAPLPVSQQPTATWADIVRPARHDQVFKREIDGKLEKAETQLRLLEESSAAEDHSVPVDLRLNRMRRALVGLHKTDAKDKAAALWERAEAYRSELPNAGSIDEFHRQKFVALVQTANVLLGKLQPFVTGAIFRRKYAMGRKPLSETNLDAQLLHLDRMLSKYEASLAEKLGPATRSERSRAIVAYAKAHAREHRAAVANYHQKMAALAETIRADPTHRKLSKQIDALHEAIIREERLSAAKASQCRGTSLRGSASKKLCSLDRERAALIRQRRQRFEQLSGRLQKSAPSVSP